MRNVEVFCFRDLRDLILRPGSGKADGLAVEVASRCRPFIQAMWR
jgi:hypothetical protein